MSNNTRTVTVRVREMRAGDYLLGSRRRVVFAGPIRNGKRSVVLSRVGALSDTAHVWNASTTMRVERYEP